MTNEWYYTKQKKQFGPVSEGDLKKLVAKGELAPTDKVWKKGMEKWVAAETIKGLFSGGSGSGDRPTSKSGTVSKKPAAVQEEGDKDALDFSDDDDEVVKKPAPKKGGIPVWVWIGGGVVALLFVCCGGGGIVFAVFGGGLFGGDNLEKVHKGMSTTEVEKLLGKGEVVSTQNIPGPKGSKRELKTMMYKVKRGGYEVQVMLVYEDDKLQNDPGKDLGK
jgi:GYF domain 2